MLLTPCISISGIQMADDGQIEKMTAMNMEHKTYIKNAPIGDWKLPGASIYSLSIFI